MGRQWTFMPLANISANGLDHLVGYQSNVSDSIAMSCTAVSIDMILWNNRQIIHFHGNHLQPSNWL
jgi:hypothetical protein